MDPEGDDTQVNVDISAETDKRRTEQIEVDHTHMEPVGAQHTEIDNSERSQVKQQEEQHLIQIVASNEEINRRIGALIEQKQRELDENNCQEFCGVHPGFQDLENQCARTAAVFVPRAGGKSHIKVSRVVNMYGPQTRALGQRVNERPDNSEHKPATNMMDGIEERLANMEKHLKLTGSSKSDVYSRLKNLEERILFLESLSPEYFTSGAPPVKRSRQASIPDSRTHINQDLSLSEIDMRIQALKETLQQYSQR
ncbi:MAP3K12-binding inhibitory protein 1-like [Ruditapes philippinarum]|uniref:MAP3K12-binding inhibitory protein 1-like n=1 Tax=Ruditapes philippinarum TaxID=129788 RepID=UPI00295AE5C2|nr:MAP3K12-binding inhibitory protein 1-like [Ruditapes philippinarum]